MHSVWLRQCFARDQSAAKPHGDYGGVSFDTYITKEKPPHINLFGSERVFVDLIDRPGGTIENSSEIHPETFVILRLCVIVFRFNAETRRVCQYRSSRLSCCCTSNRPLRKTLGFIDSTLSRILYFYPAIPARSSTLHPRSYLSNFYSYVKRVKIESVKCTYRLLDILTAYAKISPKTVRMPVDTWKQS